jgi:hypothetical protein
MAPQQASSYLPCFPPMLAMNDTHQASHFTASASSPALRARTLPWIAAIAAAAVLAACGGGGSTDGADASGAALSRPVTTGASCSFAHLFVTVQEVRAVQLIDGTEQTIGIVLPGGPQHIDLLNLGGGLLQALGAAGMGGGKYTQGELAPDADGSGTANAVQPTGGNLAPLSVPGATQSGLKVQGDFVVPSGQTGDLALQGFDPCQAVVQTGSPTAPRFQLKPDLTAQASAIIVAPSNVQGSVFRVNTTIGGNQSNPVSATLKSGFVIAWRSATVNTEQQTVQSVCWQRYGADRSAAGGEVCTGTAPALSSQGPAIAALADGSFVIAWAAQGGILAQHYDANGVAVGAIQQVSSAAVGNEQVAAAGLAAGGYVITWGAPQPGSDADILARVFGADGAPLGAEFRVNTFTGTALRGLPAVAALSTGGFVVTWTSSQDVSRGSAIFAQRFTAAGAPVGSEMLVDTTAEINATSPAVAGLGGGGYVIAWTVNSMIVTQRFAADGSPLGAETAVDAPPPPDPNLICGATPQGPTPCVITQGAPAVIALSDGGYVVSWHSSGLPSTADPSGTHKPGTYARRFAADGTPTGGSVFVGSSTPMPAGSLLIAWSDFTNTQDGFDVYARFLAPQDLLITTSP